MGKERQVSIDYLRALFSVCVVAVHLGYISPSNIFSKEFHIDHSFTLSDFANFYILLLAVPVFFLISNYLFSQKATNFSFCYLYIKRISKIALFWIVLHTIFKYEGWEVIDWLPNTLMGLAYFVLSGGHILTPV